MSKLNKVMADDVTQTVNVDFRMCKDNRLSHEALGLAVRIQSYNTDPSKGRVWNFTIKGLMELYPNGERSNRTALNELKEKGYVTEERIRDEKGKFVDSVYTFHQKPIHPDCQKRNVGNRNVGKRNMENLSVGKPNGVSPHEDNQGQYKL